MSPHVVICQTNHLAPFGHQLTLDLKTFRLLDLWLSDLLTLFISSFALILLPFALALLKCSFYLLSSIATFDFQTFWPLTFRPSTFDFQTQKNTLEYLLRYKKYIKQLMAIPKLLNFYAPELLCSLRPWTFWPLDLGLSDQKNTLEYLLRYKKYVK